MATGDECTPWSAGISGATSLGDVKGVSATRHQLLSSCAKQMRLT